MSEFQVKRVLIANRGEIARRLIRYYKQRGVESVVAFSEADAEQDYLDEADYAVYLNGRTVNETYLDPQRVVSAAIDAATQFSLLWEFQAGSCTSGRPRRTQTVARSRPRA